LKAIMATVHLPKWSFSTIASACFSRFRATFRTLPTSNQRKFV